MQTYAKGSIDGLFMKLCGEADAMLATACKHGDRTLADAEAEGEENPSTELQKVIRKFQQLGKPERVA